MINKENIIALVCETVVRQEYYRILLTPSASQVTLAVSQVTPVASQVKRIERIFTDQTCLFTSSGCIRQFSYKDNPF